MLGEVNVIAFVNTSKNGSFVVACLFTYLEPGFWKQIQPVMTLSEKKTGAQKGKESSSRSHRREYVIAL